MRKILFVTRSLELKTIRDRVSDSSSAMFEYGLVEALNAKCDLEIVHLGSGNLPTAEISGFKFSRVDFASAGGTVKLLKKIFESKRSSGDALITSGYYPALSIALVIAKTLLGLKTFSYVFDSHRPAIRKFPRFKRAAADVYFSLGFFFVTKCTGLLVLNETFVERRRLTLPYLKTKVGVRASELEQVDPVDPEPVRRSGPIVITYAGTINSDNGILLLLDLLRTHKALDIELHVYGSGDEEAVLLEYMKSDTRVRYFGRVQDRLLQTAMKSSDFLINLRDPASISCQYAFPSKLINFLSTGTPVISNHFPGLDTEYRNHLILVDAYSVGAIFETVRHLERSPAFRALGAGAQRHVTSNNGWETIADDILAFTESV